MKNETLEEFIENYAKNYNLCYKYSEYSEEVQKMLKRIYAACFRFGLYNSQTLYMLDEALKPFEINKDLQK